VRGRPAPNYGPKKRTKLDCTTEMRLFLYGCTDGRLASVTVDDLIARHGVDRKMAEYELTVARQKRA
jgi:hypothetical protein